MSKELSTKQTDALVDKILELLDAWRSLLAARADQAKAGADHIRILAANDKKRGTTTAN